MNCDDIKILALLYNMTVNSCVSYVLTCDVYFESKEEEQEGVAKLLKIKNDLDRLATQIQDLCIKNKVTLTLGTYKEEYTELNYLSYKFIKDYIKKDFENDVSKFNEMVESFNLSQGVKELVSRINDIKLF